MDFERARDKFRYQDPNYHDQVRPSNEVVEQARAENNIDAIHQLAIQLDPWMNKKVVEAAHELALDMMEVTKEDSSTIEDSNTEDLKEIIKKAKLMYFKRRTKENIVKFKQALNGDEEIYARSKEPREDEDTTDYEPMTMHDWFGDDEDSFMNGGLDIYSDKRFATLIKMLKEWIGWNEDPVDLGKQSKELWDTLSRKLVVEELATLFGRNLEDFTSDDMEKLNDAYTDEPWNDYDDGFAKSLGTTLGTNIEGLFRKNLSEVVQKDLEMLEQAQDMFSRNVYPSELIKPFTIYPMSSISMDPSEFSDEDIAEVFDEELFSMDPEEMTNKDLEILKQAYNMFSRNVYSSELSDEDFNLIYQIFYDTNLRYWDDMGKVHWAEVAANLFGRKLDDLSEEDRKRLDEILEEGYPYMGNRLAS